MLLMRWTAQRSMRELGDDLIVKTMGVLISRASSELKGLVEEHATILGRERDLVEMALQVLLKWPFRFRFSNWKKGLPEGLLKTKSGIP
jgi:hypothetical protein